MESKVKLYVENKVKLSIKSRKKLSNAGFSIVEVMVGFALLMVAGYLAMNSFGQLHKMKSTNDTASAIDVRINEIIENIRLQPTSQIIQYAENPQAFLAEENLTMAWSLHSEGPTASCAECPGRYGYIVTPLNKSASDLYLVTIVFTHKEWANPKTFEFLVSK